jgi:competence protein ComEC
VPLALAVAAWSGALHPISTPWLPAAAVLVAGLAWRRPLVLVAGVLVLAAALSATAWQGLRPVSDGPWTGTATLVSDPVAGRHGQVRADLRLPDGSRVEARADGGAAGLLLERAAGQRLAVAGRLEPPPEHAPWLVPRHVRGVLVVDVVSGWTDGHLLTRATNGLRRTLVHGARSLGDDERALFTGIVLGDDREQSAEDADAFRGAGLGHLLAVSGQNVAFVLVVVQPLARRLGRRPRLVLLVTVLVGFAGLTRFEPSVLRAVAMAGIAAVATASGRRSTGVQVLALAVTALVLVDPLLVHSLGFRLSVAASAGILVLAPPLRDRLPGPALLVDALSVTLAAQAAVAPLVVPAFGGLPVVSLPANVLATPAAGPVTAWGLTAGVVAGVLPDSWAAAAHVPTRVLLGWIDGVAHLAVRAPLGELGLAHVAALVLLVPSVLWCVSRRRVAFAVAGALAVVGVLALPAIGLRGPHRLEAELPGGGLLWRRGGGTALVVDGRSDPEDLLEALRRAGVTELDLVVGRTVGAGDVLAELRRRYPGATAIGPEGLQGASTVEAPARLRVGSLVVLATPSADRLEVGLEPSAPPDGGEHRVR